MCTLKTRIGIDSKPHLTPPAASHGFVLDWTIHHFAETLQTSFSAVDKDALHVVYMHDDPSEPREQEPPISRIPNELLSLIFEHGYFLNDGPADDDFRQAVCLTCSTWRAVAVNTPSIWSVIHLSPGNVEHRLKALPVLFSRSKDHPLDIHLTCFWCPTISGPVMEAIVPHSRRWRHLSIITSNTDIFDHFRDVSAPALKSFNVTHFSSQQILDVERPMFQGGMLPNLSCLRLRNVSIRHIPLPLNQLKRLELRVYGTWPRHLEIQEALCGLESCLEEFVVHVKPTDVLRDVDHLGRSPILLPALHTFHVFTSEWLTTDVASFVRLFRTPRLRSLVVQDCCVTPGVSGHEIMRYSAGKGSSSDDLPKLFVDAADVFTAWTALAPTTAISILELHRVRWPDRSRLAHMLACIPNLERLLISEVNATNFLRATSGCHQQPFSISSLRTLQLSVKRRKGSIPEDLTLLLQSFVTPRLNTLILENLTSDEWTNLVAAFSPDGKQAYPALTSLELCNVGDIVGPYPSPAEAFTRLRTLSLFGVESNSLLRLLVPQANCPITWPDLETILIHGDKHANKPLLYGILDARKEMLRPIKNLKLDSEYTLNQDAWAWLECNATVTKVTHNS